MTTEEKQIEFLNRLYTNIEGYKNLRFQLPITICTLLIAVIGFVLSSANLLETTFQRIILILVFTIIGLLGLISLNFVHNQYRDLAEDIHYLWEKLGMHGEDYIKNNKKPGMNPKQLAPEIFKIGYWSIIIFTLIGILLTSIK